MLASRANPKKSQVVASDRLERFHRALRVTFNCETTEGLHSLNFLANILSKVIFVKKKKPVERQPVVVF